MKNLVKFYCFNRNCKASIFYPVSCQIVEFPFEDRLDQAVSCTLCEHSMISKTFLRVERELKALLTFRPVKRFILVSKSFEQAKELTTLFPDDSSGSNFEYFNSVQFAIEYLNVVSGINTLLPIAIVIDAIAMENELIEFLEFFSQIRFARNVSVPVFLICNLITFQIKSLKDNYPFIRLVIVNQLDKDFFRNSISVY